MTNLKRPLSRGLATAATWAITTAVGAQGFVWPPAAGDRMARGESETTQIQAIEGPPAASQTASPWAADPLPADSLSADRLPEDKPLNFAARPTAAVVNQPQPTVAASLAGGQTQWKILENPNGPHAALIFDPVRQVFAVYHIDAASGQIMLKSVRNLAADLRLEQFNSGAPAPKDIQAMLDEARERPR